MRRLLALAAVVVGCHRAPPPPSPDTPEGALWRLRDALARDAALDDTLVDTRLLAQARLLARMRRIHDIQEGHARAVTDDGWRALLDDLDRAERPDRARRTWAPLRARLGDGRCVRVRDATTPAELAAVAAVADEWPASARALHATVSARAAGVRAGVFRCAQGAEVTAVTAPGDAGDARRRVVALDASDAGP